MVELQDGTIQGHLGGSIWFLYRDGTTFFSIQTEYSTSVPLETFQQEGFISTSEVHADPDLEGKQN